MLGVMKYSKSYLKFHSKQNLRNLYSSLRESWIESRKSKINLYWLEKLESIKRPAARNLINTICHDNVLGYENPTGPAKKGTLLEYVLLEKKKHSDKVLLTRVGEFYEAFGIDAIMLVEHCGLNAMGGKPKAGCPIKNLQATLDGLTRAGLSAVVYEEIIDTDSQRGPKTKLKIKKRALTQVVSPGSPNYIYQMCLRPDDIEFGESRPYLGINYTPQGYSVSEIYLDQKSVIISERLTEEAVEMIMNSYGFSEPVYIQGIDMSSSSSRFLRNTNAVNSIHRLTDYPPHLFHSQVLNTVAKDMEIAPNDFRIVQRDCSDTGRPRPLYTSTALQIGLLPNENVPDLVSYLLPPRHYAHSARFFKRWLLSPPPYHLADSMRALCGHLRSLEVAMPEVPVPSIGKVVSLLAANQCNVPLFRDVRATLEVLVTMLDNNNIDNNNSNNNSNNPYACLTGALLELTSHESGLPTTKDVIYDKAKQMVQLIDSVVYCRVHSNDYYEDQNQYYSSINVVKDDVNDNNDTNYKIFKADANVSEDQHVEQAISRDMNGIIPNSFFDNNELDFRCCVQRHCPSLDPEGRVNDAFEAVEEAARTLIEAVIGDYPADADIIHDSLNNVLSLKNKPKEEGDKESGRYIAQLDRNRKPMGRRYTTDAVLKCTSIYVSACDTARQEVEQLLQALSEAVYADVATVVQAAHWSVILQAANAHTVAALQRGWVLPVLGPRENQPPEGAFATLADDIIDTSLPISTTPPTATQILFSSSSGSLSPPATTELKATPGSITSTSIQSQQQTQQHQEPMVLDGLMPFWMTPSDGAICNTFTLAGIFLLTAPNMSGKSTIMRSTLVAALLANAGLLVPCRRYAHIPRFDTFFLRTASYDVPAEGKSAFGLEMDDMRVVLRDANRRSLVMIDELGKGTSSRDGSSLAGALLEHLDKSGVNGIFATHLHELFQLPLAVDRVTRKRMGIAFDSNDSNSNNNNSSSTSTSSNEVKPRWTFTLEDGMCTDSMASHTARSYGLPSQLIDRAEELADHFDKIFTPTNNINHDNNGNDNNASDNSESRLDYVPPVVSAGKKPVSTRNQDVQAPVTTPLYADSSSSSSSSSGDRQINSKSSSTTLSTTSTTTERDYYLGGTVQKCSVGVLQTTMRRITGTRKLPVVVQLSDYNVNANFNVNVNAEIDTITDESYENHVIYAPPASLEGRACVYVLILHGDNNGDRVYVGETESIRQRLHQHRSGSFGKDYSRITALIASSPNKSSARGTETLLISTLKAEGYHVDGGGSDGSHRLFGT